jgi:hypothetical protein
MAPASSRAVLFISLLDCLLGTCLFQLVCLFDFTPVQRPPRRLQGRRGLGEARLDGPFQGAPEAGPNWLDRSAAYAISATVILVVIVGMFTAQLNMLSVGMAEQKTQLNMLSVGMAEQKTQLNMLSEGMAQQKTQLNMLSEGMAQQKADVAELKSGMARLQESIGELQNATPLRVDVMTKASLLKR